MARQLQRRIARWARCRGVVSGTLSRCSQPPIAERRAERGRRSLYSAIGRCDRHCGGGGGEPDRPLGLRVRRNGPPSRGRALESSVFGERRGGDPHDRTF